MRCKNCKNEFKYFSLLKSFWFGYADIKCEKCGAIFEHKFQNRLLVIILIGLPFAISYFLIEDKNTAFKIVGFVSMAAFLSLITPLVNIFNRVK